MKLRCRGHAIVQLTQESSPTDSPRQPRIHSPLLACWLVAQHLRRHHKADHSWLLLLIRAIGIHRLSARGSALPCQNHPKSIMQEWLTRLQAPGVWTILHKGDDVDVFTLCFSTAGYD